MVPILTPKDKVIVNCVMLATGVQVLEWRPLCCVQMEHTVTQLARENVFCVQQVLGEVLCPATDHIIHTWYCTFVHTFIPVS